MDISLFGLSLWSTFFGPLFQGLRREERKKGWLGALSGLLGGRELGNLRRLKVSPILGL